MRSKKPIYIIILLLVLFSSLGFTNEMPTNRLHEHGSARLLITTHGNNLEVMLESPAVNLFGFEHLPTSDRDHQIIHDMTEVLESATNLFNMDEAGCALENVAIDSTQILAHELSKHAENGEDSDFAAFEHSDFPDETETVTAHSDVDALWIFTCPYPDKFKGIAIKFFTAFPEKFTHINIEWHTAKSAGTLVLLQDDTLSFTPEIPSLTMDMK